MTFGSSSDVMVKSKNLPLDKPKRIHIPNDPRVNLDHHFSHDGVGAIDVGENLCIVSKAWIKKVGIVAVPERVDTPQHREQSPEGRKKHVSPGPKIVQEVRKTLPGVEFFGSVKLVRRPGPEESTQKITVSTSATSGSLKPKSKTSDKTSNPVNRRIASKTLVAVPRSEDLLRQAKMDKNLKRSASGSGNRNEPLVSRHGSAKHSTPSSAAANPNPARRNLPAIPRGGPK